MKPWHKVVTPREDLREGRPLDASEFAVNLDDVRKNEKAPDVYRNPERFFAHTYMTQSLAELGAGVIRRLSGISVETSAVYNLATRFGGGKTHALTLLYHLARLGPDADRLPGVRALLERAEVSTVPRARVAVFVGTEFDPHAGRGGNDGTPLRQTPWGEIAFQLGGGAALDVLALHEERLAAPAGDVIRQMLPDEPCLILLDEVMSYISKERRSGMAGQLYTFLHSLSEVARGRADVVLAVSLPGSVLEMNTEDFDDYNKISKLLNRLGKAVAVVAETETVEIIRRRLFEWDDRMVAQDGRVLLPKDAVSTCNEYADWVIDHRQQLGDFPFDHAREVFASTYPFHPSALSVFQRKWQSLPRFQQTRGVLRLLALWISRAYSTNFKGAHKDALIGLGSAPLEDSDFRTAVFDQLGEQKLNTAVTVDVVADEKAKERSNSQRLDVEAVETIRKARLHQKVATAIFFESNGGQASGEATVPEIRMAVGEPGLDIGNIETALEALTTSCYYLSVVANRYRFGIQGNLNKMLADRRGSVADAEVAAKVRLEVEKAFGDKPPVERIPFPERSNAVPDRPALTFAVLPPEQPLQDERTLGFVESMTKECGGKGRTFKSAIIWCVPDESSALEQDARTVLAWEAIQKEEAGRIDDQQKSQLAENLGRSRRDLRESVWRAYKNAVFLDRDNSLRVLDLGHLNSSMAPDMTRLIIGRLVQEDEVTDSVPPNFLVRNWPPALVEWSTKGVRDMFFAAPQFPRLLNGDAVKDTISRGVAAGQLAYVTKSGDGYDPFLFRADLPIADVEIRDNVFIIKKETAEKYLQAKTAPPVETVSIGAATTTAAARSTPAAQMDDEPVETSAPASTKISTIRWKGEVPSQKWTNFYRNVLTKFAVGGGLKLTVHFEVSPEGGISPEKAEEARIALRELGLDDEIEAL